MTVRAARHKRGVQRAMEKILVIDDEAVIRRMLVRLLVKEAYRVLTASNGKEGIETMEKEKPDLIVLDLKMPHMDGIETLKRIRAVNNEVVVIILTAYGTTHTAAEAMKLGAHDFISKPFDITRVRVSIRNAVELQRLANEIARARSKLRSKASSHRKP